MAIPIPVSHAIIDTAQWGIPLTNEVNRLTPLVVAPTAWTALPLINGWANAYPSTPGQYRKLGDIVQLRGRLTGGPNASNMFILPTGFGPATDEVFTVMGYDGGKWLTASLDINSVNRNANFNCPAMASTPPVWATIANVQFSTKL